MDSVFQVQGDDYSGEIRSRHFRITEPIVAHTGPDYNGMFRVPMKPLNLGTGGETSVRAHFHTTAAIAKASVAEPELLQPTPRNPFRAARHSVAGLVMSLNAELPSIIDSSRELLAERSRNKPDPNKKAIRDVLQLPSLYPKPPVAKVSLAVRKDSSNTNAPHPLTPSSTRPFSGVESIEEEDLGGFEEDSSDEDLNDEVRSICANRKRRSTMRNTGRKKAFTVSPETKTTQMFLQAAFNLASVESSHIVRLLKGLTHDELQKRLTYSCRRLRRAMDRNDFFEAMRGLFSRRVIEAVAVGDDGGHREDHHAVVLQQQHTTVQKSKNQSFHRVRSFAGSGSGADCTTSSAAFGPSSLSKSQSFYSGGRRGGYSFTKEVPDPPNLTAECLLVQRADTDVLFALLRGESTFNTVEVRVVQQRLEPIVYGSLLDSTLRLMQVIFYRDTYAIVHSLVSTFEIKILLNLLRKVFEGSPVPEYYEGILLEADITPKLIADVGKISILIDRAAQGSVLLLDLREGLKNEFPEAIESYARLQSLLLKRLDEVTVHYLGNSEESKMNQKIASGNLTDNDYEELQRALYADDESLKAIQEQPEQKRDLSSLLKRLKATHTNKTRNELHNRHKEMVCDQYMRDRIASREYTRHTWAVKDGQLVQLQNISHLISAIKRALMQVQCVDAI